MIRFYLDEDISDQVARIARGLGIDVDSSHERERDSLSDEAQLRLAAKDGRCLVTYNGRHFAPLTREFLARGWPHAGVLIVAQSLRNDDFIGIARALVAYAELYPEGVPSYVVDYLHPVPAE